MYVGDGGGDFCPVTRMRKVPNSSFMIFDLHSLVSHIFP